MNGSGAAVDGTGLRWRHEVLGEFEVSLDEVKQIVWNNPPLQNAVSQEQGGDTITLNNGDHLTGFVTSLSKQGVELIPASSTQPVTIPYARIASLALANPDQAAASLHIPSHAYRWHKDLRRRFKLLRVMNSHGLPPHPGSRPGRFRSWSRRSPASSSVQAATG